MQRTNNPVAMRARILEYAGVEFLKHGYEGAKLNSIIANAGITKGSVFHHFASKEDIAMHWLRAEIPSVLEHAWQLPLQSSPDVIAVLKGIFTAAATDHPHHFALLALSASGLEEAPALRAQVQAYHHEWHQMVAQALRAGQKEKSVHRAIQAEDESHMIVALAQGIAWHSRICGAVAMPGCLRSAIAYFDTLRPE